MRDGGAERERQIANEKRLVKKTRRGTVKVTLKRAGADIEKLKEESIP